jgi:RNA polymerase sigma factor (sigma-70 family)
MFPSTRRSAIVASYSAQPEERRQAFEKIVAAYWKPVYKFIRFRWPEQGEDAKDLTQAFFARAMEKDFFKSYNPEKASFRTFVRTCVTHFVINESKYAQRLKRGGNSESVPLEAHHEAAGEGVEEFFEKEWIRNMFSLALEDLQELCSRRGKTVHFALFERYDIERAERAETSYADLATEYGVAVTDVTNYLAWTRREFRRLIMDRIRAITIDDDEFRREVRLILGGNP